MTLLLRVTSIIQARMGDMLRIKKCFLFFSYSISIFDCRIAVSLFLFIFGTLSKIFCYICPTVSKTSNATDQDNILTRRRTDKRIWCTKCNTPNKYSVQYRFFNNKTILCLCRYVPTWVILSIASDLISTFKQLLRRRVINLCSIQKH